MNSSDMTAFTKYWPLLSLLLVTLVGAFAITWGIQGGLHQWMHYLMGLFLTIFSLLKLFNLSSFADGFQMYDLIAQRSRVYAYIYPFIELFLGLAYLSFLWPRGVYFFTMVIMLISAAGVIRALRAGLDVRCACMGTVLTVPLSTVTLTEDISMILMATIMLLMT